MSKIYQIPTLLTGSVGVMPQQKYAMFGDDLSAVTTPGYLNTIDTAVPISQGDIISAYYNYDLNTESGDYAIFIANVSNSGIITLEQWNSGLVRANGTESAGSVTANGQYGVITTANRTINAYSAATITFTNSYITASSVLLLTVSAGDAVYYYTVQCSSIVSNGSAAITLYNPSNNSVTGALSISYYVM